MFVCAPSVASQYGYGTVAYCPAFCVIFKRVSCAKVKSQSHLTLFFVSSILVLKLVKDKPNEKEHKNG